MRSRTYICLTVRVARFAHKCQHCGHEIHKKHLYLDGRLGTCAVPGAKAEIHRYHLPCAEKVLPGISTKELLSFIPNKFHR